MLPHCTARSPLLRLWGSGLCRSVQRGKYEVIVCAKMPRPPASEAAVGLQTFTLLSQIWPRRQCSWCSHTPVALPELAVSSPLVESRELNAHLQALAMVTINPRGELGGFAFVASLKLGAFLHSGWTVSSFPVSHAAPWDPSLIPKHRTCTTGLQGKCSTVGRNARREGRSPELVAQMSQVHLLSVPQGNTGPPSSARSQDLPGIWDGGTCFRNPRDLKGFSISP